MVTSVTCDMCGCSCQKAREVNGTFDPRLFSSDAKEGFIRIRLLIQAYTTVEIYAARAGAIGASKMKGMDLCAGCLHQVLAAMVASLAAANESKETRGNPEAGIPCPACGEMAKPVFTGKVFTGYVCPICDHEVKDQ